MSQDRSHLWSSDDPIRIGVSSCLLGHQVRWNGEAKRNAFLVDVLEPYVEWTAVCPEVEAGLGIPRPPIRFLERGGEVRLVAHKTDEDVTRKLESYSTKRVRALEKLDLCGYVLKKDSPSCGMERVKVWSEKGQARRDGRGVFARALLERLPALPVEEEGRLNDPALRENWIERVFAYRRLRTLLEGRFAIGDLVRFHTAHKLQLMAHSPKAYGQLGRLVGEAKGMPRGELRQEYAKGFMDGLRPKATRRRNVNVLEHVMGYFRKDLGPAERGMLHEVVQEYGSGLVPLAVPIALVRHTVKRLGVDYLAGQVYLEPHPKELMLRNHV